GVVFESDAFGAAHLASGRLQPVFADGMTLEITQHFAVCPARNKSRPEVVLFLQWLREESGKLAST
ncbi:hypothetical protein ABTE34_20745, partial [Acinetobacter baumannii]